MNDAKSVPDRLVIYHANCDDGTAAAAVADHALTGSVDFLAANYGDAPPDVKGKIVYILDFSYSPEVTRELAEEARVVMVLDHHISAMKGFEAAFPMKPVEFNGGIVREGRVCTFSDSELGLHVLFDMDRSGAGLAWDHFMNGNAQPEFIKHIQANDLWKPVDHTKETIRWIRSHPHSIESYRGLMAELENPETVVRARKEGAAIERFFMASVKNQIDWSDVRVIELAGVKGLAVNGPRMMISEMGHILAESCHSFGCVWYPRNGKAYVSLRSTDDGPDVSEIAKKYNGGGHRNAAGFEMDLFGFVMGVYTGDKA